MKQLVLIRHGESKWNLENRFTGWVDVDLTPVGKEQARAEGKPEEMLEKIAQGKLQKFYKENTLLSQQFVKDNSKTITQYLDGVSKGLTVNQFKRISIG